MGNVQECSCLEQSDYSFFQFVLMVVVPPKVNFFPGNEPNYANIFISHPIGTDISVTNETTLKIEDKLNTILAKYMDEDDTTGVSCESTFDPFYYITSWRRNK